jgi:IrrE N-terminal-like domain
MALLKQKIAVRPQAEPRITDLVRKLLREGEAEGVLPTPIDRLFAIAKVTNIDQLPDEAFLQTLTGQARGFFRSAMQKLRGIADLRTRQTYIPPDPHNGRELFVKAHELGHQVMSWHAIDPAYLDDSESLSPAAKTAFEQEANFFGAETVFQGSRFRTLARDFQPSFPAIFELARQHGASRQATAWRFVEEQDEALVLLQYYPTNAVDQEGNRVLALWKSISSQNFSKRYSEIDLPPTLRTGHPWAAARDVDRPCEGNENISVAGDTTAFQWHAWWNGYTLLVLLRRKPVIRLVGDWLKP